MKKKIEEAKTVLMGLIPVASADLTSGTGGIKGVAKKGDVVELIVTVINYAIIVIGVLAVLIFVYAGYLYLTAGGNEEKITTAKNVVLYAVVGIVVSVLGFVAVNTVQRFFVNG